LGGHRIRDRHTGQRQGGGGLRRAAKVDANHGAIREALRAVGWLVVDTSKVPAFVDLMAFKASRVELVEVKVKRGKLTPAQQVLHTALARAGVEVKVLRSVEDAVRL
jgi:hypothetical protein